MAYSPFAWKDDLAGGTPITAARLNVIENAISSAAAIADANAVTLAANKNAIVLIGTGIDNTGNTDSSTAVQAILDSAPVGATIVNPSGSILRLNKGLTVNKARTRITGSGEWRFRSGGTYGVDPSGQNGFIDLRGDYCWVDGLYVTNPDAILNRGICFIANYGKATDNTLIGFGAGIHISPAGEYHDFTVSGNHIYDLIGRGGGSSDTTSIGEDYGDGIMCWGASITVTGNIVTCKDGSDARIGIHVEGLNDQARVPWAAHDHRLATISGNVVRGKFRRGIVTEQVDHTIITNNVVADSTWWEIAIISSMHCIVSNNTVVRTRTAADVQGNYWNPSRSCIMLYNIGAGSSIINPIVTDNTIRVTSTGVAYAAIQVLGNDGSVPGVIGGRIAGNRIFSEGVLSHGIYVQSSTDLEIDSNRIGNFSNTGIYTYGPVNTKIRLNTINGPSSTNSSEAIHVEGGSRSTVDNNVLSTCGQGIAIYNQTVRASANANTFDTLTTGINAYGCATPFVSNNGTYVSVTTPRSNMPSGAITTGNSV